MPNKENDVEIQRSEVYCPGCKQIIKAVLMDGRAKGYCAVCREYVEALQLT